MTVERSSDLPDLPGEGEQQIRQRLRAFENANTDRVPEALIAVYIRDVRSLLALLDTERAKLSAALGAADFHQQRTVFLEQQVASLSADLARREQEIERLRTLAKEATNGWACYAKSTLERDEIGRLHTEIDRAAADPREKT